MIFSKLIKTSVRVEQVSRSLWVDHYRYVPKLDKKLHSGWLLGQASHRGWMVESKTVSPLDLGSETHQIVLKSTRDPALELRAAARGVPSLRTRTTFFLYWSPWQLVENFPPLALKPTWNWMGIYACAMNLDLVFGGLSSKRVLQIKNRFREIN
jgi:hypothetical protein